MKKIAELIMFTLFFSSLAGLGLMGGIFCFVGVARLVARILA